MSLDGRYADVQKDASGTPLSFMARGEHAVVSITNIIENFREWISALEGEPERDIWRVDTPKGTCELHHMRQPITGDDEPNGYWVIFRWDD